MRRRTALRKADDFVDQLDLSNFHFLWCAAGGRATNVTTAYRVDVRNGLRTRLFPAFALVPLV
jgi:hypothetical protein